jgi:limonene-1,2-epoxide hydrolase
MAGDAAEVVRGFCASWSRMDIDEIMAFFSDDAVYHNMPGPPVNGREAIRSSIQRFLGGWKETHWEIVNLAAAAPIVFAERVDHIAGVGGQRVDLPVTGVFEVEDDKIRAWRDYFDLASYTRAMTPG